MTHHYDDCKVNHGYDGLTPAAVIGFNGEKVLNLQHLMTMVLECEDEYLLFEMEDANGCNVVLEREQASGPSHPLSLFCFFFFWGGGHLRTLMGCSVFFSSLVYGRQEAPHQYY